MDKQKKEYKYLVTMQVYVNHEQVGGEYKNVICNSPDDCFEFVKQEVEINLKGYNTRTDEKIIHEPFNKDDLGTVVKWINQTTNESWLWWYFFIKLPVFQTKGQQNE